MFVVYVEHLTINSAREATRKEKIRYANES